jgi:glycosyltransferase involved in cell wall biosynthesis
VRRHGVELVWFVGPVYETTDAPFIFTVWDLQHRLQPWFPEVSASGRWAFRERNYGRVLPRAALVIAPNRAGQREVERFYHVPPERIRLLPHPTPAFALHPPAALPDVRAKFGLQRPFLLYPAQFWAHKNHTGLLRAAKALEQRHGQLVDVALVGSEKGNLAHVRREVARLSLGERVRFLGFVNRDELIALYRNAEALVYLSFFGPENLPPLEAFALGCPVVASAVDGAEEQLGEAALLVDPRDPLQVADAVSRLRTEPGLRERLVARGAARARQWTAGDYVDKVLGEIDRFAPVRACWSDETMPIA